MGAGHRAGWYSYDMLDNDRQPSAMTIIPELQSLAVGMVFPALPDRTDGFTLLAFEPPHYLVLGWKGPDRRVLVTWAFVLEHQRNGATRLIVRARGGPDYRFNRLPRWLSKRAIGLVHFF